MRLAFLLFLLATSCSQTPLREPTLAGAPMAYDSTAEGNIKAAASKWLGDENVCFDIAISLKGFDVQKIQSLRWTLAWVDEKNQHRLLNLNPRNPANEQVIGPYGAYHEWTETYRTCAPTKDPEAVKSLVLTPRNLNLPDKRSLELRWPTD